MLDSISHMTPKNFFEITVYGMKMLSFCHVYVMLLWPSIHIVTKIYRFKYMALYNSQRCRHMIKLYFLSLKLYFFLS